MTTPDQELTKNKAEQVNPSPDRPVEPAESLMDKRANEDSQQLNKLYRELSPEQKNQFPQAQEKAAEILQNLIKGDLVYDGLTHEESSVLKKVREAYIKFEKSTPGENFVCKFGNPLDQKIYDNLFQKIAFEELLSGQKIADNNKANAIREDIGIPKQEAKTPAPTAKIETPANSTAEQVKAAFEALGGGVRAGVIEKVLDYDKRIRAALAGKPIKPGDTFEGLKKDFRFFTRQEWAEDFDIKKIWEGKE